MPDVMLAFTINAAIAPIPTILGGFITDKGKANISIILGGILFGCWIYTYRICYYKRDAIF